MVQDKTLIAIGAMACVTILETAAILTHQDGQLFLAAVGLLSTLGVLALKDVFWPSEKGKK